MRRAVQNPDGTTAGTIGDECLIGQVVGPVLNPRSKGDERTDAEIDAHLSISGLTLEEVKQLQGRAIAIFPIEE